MRIARTVCSIFSVITRRTKRFVLQACEPFASCRWMLGNEEAFEFSNSVVHQLCWWHKLGSFSWYISFVKLLPWEQAMLTGQMGGKLSFARMGEQTGFPHSPWLSLTPFPEQEPGINSVYLYPLTLRWRNLESSFPEHTLCAQSNFS